MAAGAKVDCSKTSSEVLMLLHDVTLAPEETHHRADVNGQIPTKEMSKNKKKTIISCQKKTKKKQNTKE